MTKDAAIALMQLQGCPDAEAEFIPGDFPGWTVRADRRNDPNRPWARFGAAPSLRSAVAMAGFDVPPAAVPSFATRGPQVVRGAEHIATARSASMAHRIANALNAYTPDASGT